MNSLHPYSHCRPALRLMAAAALAALCGMAAQAQENAPKTQTKADTQADEAADRAERSLPQVVVQNKQLARDGVSDREAYTTRGVQVAGKTPRALREIPQSVSVFTEQRLRDQGQVDAARMLEWMPGVFNERARDTDAPSFSSRGFDLDNVSIDGSLAGSSFWQMPGDLSIYDQVEVLRGPNGLFSGGGRSGSPGGQINFTRKRPLESAQTQAEAALGSWKQRRATVDVNRRLLADGSLGVRLVASQANREYFFRNASRKNTTLYAVAAWQPVASLTLTAGTDWERRRGKPWTAGLPMRGDGTFPGYSRRMSSVAPWAMWKADTNGFFAEADWQFHDDWKLKTTYAWRKEATDWDFGYVSGVVDPIPGSSQSALYQQSQRRKALDGDRTLDVTLTGKFNWLGRSHDVIAGADVLRRKYHLLTPVEYPYGYRPTPTYPDNPVPVDPGTLQAAPWRPAVWGNNTWSTTPRRTWGVHASTRLRVLEKLTVIAGGRLSSYHYGGYYNPGRNQAANGAYRKDNIFTPFAAVNWDFNPAASVYVSYTDIFSVNNSYDIHGKMLPPVTGANWELGVKTEWLDKRLNGSVALYQTDRKNQTRRDPDAPYPCPASPIGGYCYIADNQQRVRGIELELNGQLRPDLRVSLGATLQHNRRTRYLDNTGKPRPETTWNEDVPRRTFRAWADWRLPVTGSTWRLGGGVRANSGYFTERSASGRVPAARVSQGGYAIWDVMLAWEPNPHWSVQLNAYNLFDKVYFSQVGTSWVNFGEPRSFMLTARVRF